MGGPLGQHQAVATAAVGFDDVGEDLLVAILVSGQRAMNASNRARKR